MSVTRIGFTTPNSLSEEHRSAILARVVPDYRRKGWSLAHNAGTEAILVRRSLWGKQRRLKVTVDPAGIVRARSLDSEG